MDTDTPTVTPELTALINGLIPTLRLVIRQELQALKNLDEPWYDTTEVEIMSCGRVKADTLRKWLRYGQIDGETDGRQIRIYQSAVEELRNNKWRPSRQPDPSKMPSSKRPKKFPIQSVAS